ncbi:ThiF family adenylyltransferase [Caballeronia grimmiae]|uniref:ThiF family adenylyltransferase n=1 Tax=Caballeronia grimmiae TaxID=1071679 RepID=UPI0038BA7287
MLPHVEESGVVCLGKLSESKGYSAPDQGVQDVLAAFDTFLDKCTDIAWVVAEFEREALAYWNRFCQFSAKQRMRWRVRQLVNAVGRVDSLVEGRVAVYEAGRIAVASGPGIDPNFLARRHRLSRGTLDFARAVFVPLPASVCWTPSSWPRSFEELAALLHEATAAFFDLLAWCSSDPKGPPAGFVILTAANAVYAYQLTPAIVPKLTSPGIVPLEVTRIDPDWALVRDQRLDRVNQRRAKRVLVLGCGSLGAPLAIGLVKAGVQRLTMVDMDDLMPENVSRHPLGMRSLFQSKAIELASELNADVPGAQVKGHRAMAADWILAQCRPGEWDLVIDCTGEESVRCFLGQVRQSIFDSTPIVHAWMEPFCAASHVVLLDEDTVWPNDDPVERVHAAKWVDDMQIVLPACNSGFHEYGPTDVGQAAFTACECVLSVLDAQAPLPSAVWSMVRSSSFFGSLGVNVIPTKLVPQSDDVHYALKLTRGFNEVFFPEGPSQ